MFKVLASALLVLLAVTETSAQTTYEDVINRVRVSHEAMTATVTSTYEPRASALFSGQKYRPIQFLTSFHVDVTDRVNISVQTDLFGSFGEPKTLDTYTKRVEPQSNNFVPDPQIQTTYDGHTTEFSANAGVTLLPALEIYGGITRFGLGNTSTYKDPVQESSTDLNTVFAGISMGLASHYTKGRLSLVGNAEWYPHLTKTDHYSFRFNDVPNYSDDVSTMASGYALGGAVGVQITNRIAAFVKGSFRDTKTPFGNKLFRITSDEIPQTMRWKAISYGITYRLGN